MENVLILLMMIIIGAVIGGVTNSLAIKMLFRPYQTMYIGKWKLPFTPGLIPKRREELASQLGRMVVEYLLTPEGLKKKLQEPAFKKQVTDWARTETAVFLDKQLSLNDLLQKAGFSLDEKDIRAKLSGWSVGKYGELMENNKDKRVNEFVKGSWKEKIDRTGVELADHVQHQFVQYLKSEQAREKIGNLIDDYLEDKGFIANMISSFLGNERLSDKVQPVLVQYAEAYETNIWLREMVDKEIAILLDQPLVEVERKIGRENATEAIRDLFEKAVPVDKWLNRPLDEWIGSYRAELINNVVPKLTDLAGQALVDRVDTLMTQLHLAEIVEREVAAFPISRLEQLLLDISRKEFKMITYLGALLGGVIGLIQGILVLVIN